MQKTLFNIVNIKVICNSFDRLSYWTYHHSKDFQQNQITAIKGFYMFIKNQIFRLLIRMNDPSLFGFVTEEEYLKDS